MEVLSTHSQGFSYLWSWKTAMTYSFGGRTPTQPMPDGYGVGVTIMMDEPHRWGTPTRPLNRYTRMSERPAAAREVFRCPEDIGYAEWPDGLWDYAQAPPEAAGVPCYDMLGSSYQKNLRGIAWIGDLYSQLRATLNSSPNNRPASAVSEPASTILYMEPRFSYWAQPLPDDTELDPLGWHGEPQADNVVYADGSARLTHVGELQEFTYEELIDMGLEGAYADPDRAVETFLRRGDSWRMDVYPSPGALRIVYYPVPGAPAPAFDKSTIEEFYPGWPFDDYFVNDPPYGTAWVGRVHLGGSGVPPDKYFAESKNALTRPIFPPFPLGNARQTR
jgi:hypothetical protein